MFIYGAHGKNHFELEVESNDETYELMMDLQLIGEITTIFFAFETPK
jgi:hypothetical protein